MWPWGIVFSAVATFLVALVCALASPLLLVWSASWFPAIPFLAAALWLPLTAFAFLAVRGLLSTYEGINPERFRRSLSIAFVCGWLIGTAAILAGIAWIAESV